MDWDELRRSDLTLWYDPDVGFGELFVEAVQQGFRGHASAWFQAEELVAFSRSLDGLVERRLDRARLEGGPPTHQETTLSLDFFPTGLQGYLAIGVLLVESEARQGPASLSLRLEAAPAPVARFAQRLRRLAAGELGQIRLLCP